MFHVEQFFLILGVASVCLGATPSAFSPLPPCPLSEPSFSLALASNSQVLSRETSLGFEALLYGDESTARLHLCKAQAIDAASPLPAVGLALLSHSPVERAKLLKDLRVGFADATATPTEAFYLSAFLKVLEGQTSVAAHEFAERADRFPKDYFAAAWSILLLHYCNYAQDEEGRLHKEHADALQRAEEFYQRCGDEFLPACYLRSLVEESLPEISTAACDAARLFVDKLPDSPVAQNLLGHVLYRSNRAAEASVCFQRAYSSATSGNAKEIPLPALRARLYQSVALWSCGKNREALAIRRELNSLRFLSNVLDDRNIFLAWESHTLPLRLLVLRESLPHPSDIKAALLVASPKDNSQPAISCAANCIANSLYARISFCAGKKSDAFHFLKIADTSFEQFKKQENVCNESSLLLVTPYKRLLSACSIALYKAKADLYPSSAETWNEQLRHSLLIAPADSSFPPVIPSR